MAKKKSNATTILVPDPLRKSVELATDGKGTVLYTSKGYPTYMTIVPAFNCEDVADDLGTGKHPAFIVDGVDKSEIFVNTYQAIIHDGQALSLPYQNPRTSINFHDAKAACIEAGPGFHLITNWEWAAISLWCMKNGFFPRGNTDYGKSHSHPDEVGLKSGDYGITLTGSGPATWRHDGTMAGISDLVGNVWEWIDGLQLIDGKIKMPADNNFCQPENKWPDTRSMIDGVNGIQISDAITKRGWTSQWFRDIAAKEGYDVPVALKRALLYPCNAIAGNPDTPGYVWADNSKKQKSAALRGGDFVVLANAGVFYLGLTGAPSSSACNVGFRAAKIE